MKILKPWHGYLWIVSGNITGICGVFSLFNGAHVGISIGLIGGGVAEILFGVWILALLTETKE